MSAAPNRQRFISDMVRIGWNQEQAHQLSWVDYWEFGPKGWGTGGYSACRRFFVMCRSCNQEAHFASADSVRLFIVDHKGHKTQFFSRKV